MFVQGKLTVVSSVLYSLSSEPELIVDDPDGGAAMETVLHLPEAVCNVSSKGGAGNAFGTTFLGIKSAVLQEFAARQNVLCEDIWGRSRDTG